MPGIPNPSCHFLNQSRRRWKPDFIKSSNWTAYVACWCDIFWGVRILKTDNRILKKVCCSLPEIGGLNVKLKREIYSTTIPKSLKFCDVFVLRVMVWSVALCTFVSWPRTVCCDFGWFNPAMSTALAKFAFVSRDGAKWRRNLEKIKICFLSWISICCCVLQEMTCAHFLCEKVQCRQHNKSVWSSGG